MGYTFIGASARLKALDSTWEDVTVSSLPLSEIFSTYRGIYFEVDHQAYAHSVFLNLFLMRDTLTADDLTKTPQSWLTSIGDQSLPIVENLPMPREAWVKYEDAVKAGYSVDVINVGRNIDSQLPSDDKNDLLIRNHRINFSEMWQYFLVSVNGFIHRCTLGPDGLYVFDGGRTKRIANNNISGLMSFRGVGKITQIPITREMITPALNNAALCEGFFVSLPDSVNGKTVILSIGGYLHVLDGAYRVVSDKMLKINFPKLDFVDRYFQSVRSINLDTLPVVKGNSNDQQILVESFFSNDTVKAYMTLPQSFVIVVDTADIYLRHYDLDNTKLPGVFQHELPAKRLPMFGSYGRILDYVSYLEDQKVVYNCLRSDMANYLYRTTEWRSELSIDPQCYPARPGWIGDARQIEFGRFF